MSYMDNLEEWIRPLNTPLYKVEFISIGSDNKSWTTEIREHELCADTLIRELRMKSAVMSRGIDFYEYKDNKNKLGVFVGVVRHIGDIQLTKIESATQ